MAGLLGAALGAVVSRGGEAESPVLPTRPQVAWQGLEITGRISFGMNTFTEREEGSGAEDPARFDPPELAPRQWMQALKGAGARLGILTAKHHDGFCLWPSRFTEHSVRQAPWREGRGDVVHEAARAASAVGLRFGVYFPLCDLHEPATANPTAYERFLRNQLRELLTDYGEIAVLWLDPECHHARPRACTRVDRAGLVQLVRDLQPRTLIAGMGPDIRSLTVEAVIRRDEEGDVQPVGGEGWLRALFPRTDGMWFPVERRVSLRPGWFHRPREDGRLKSVAQLIEFHRRTVDRGGVLLLNVVVDPSGRIPDGDVRRLAGFGAELDRLSAASLGETQGTGETLILQLSEGGRVNQVLLAEDLRWGQRVRHYLIETSEGGDWKVVQEGRLIGNRQGIRFEAVPTSAVRLRVIEATAEPRIRRFAAFLIE